MTSRIERRVQSRKRPVSLVYVELPPGNGGMMRDLSEQGFSLRAMIPLQPSEKVAFSFILDSNSRIDGEAIVVRLDDGGHVAALEFAGLSAHARDQIRRWLDKYDELAAKEGAKPAPAPAVNSTFEELRTEIRATDARPSMPRVQLPAARPAEAVLPRAAEISGSQPPPLLKLSSVRAEAAPEILPKAASPEKMQTDVGPGLPSLAAVQAQSETELAPGPDAPPLVEAEPILAPLPALSPVPLRRESPLPLEPLSSFEGETEEPSLRWTGNFTLTRAIGFMLLLTVIAGSFVYHRQIGHGLIWMGRKLAGEENPESKQLAPSPGTELANPAAAAEGTAPSPRTEPAANVLAPTSVGTDQSSTKMSEIAATSQATPPGQAKESANTSLVPSSQVTRAPASNGPGEPPADGGQQEYQRAQAILHAPNRSAELPEAVRLLWAAVEKGNVGAEITLAELFRMGRGVSKNCAQAKILLSTAARKGSPDAQKRLEALQSEGCQE